MIKVSRIHGVNDLFELQPYLRIDEDSRKQLKNIRKKIAKTYGMACFSITWNEPIMWGHYADNNKGIVLGFELISSEYEIKKVDYPPDRVKVTFDLKTVTAEEYIQDLGFIKYVGWSYEKEYRLFLKLEDCEYIEGNYFLKIDNNLLLKEVIIGPHHPTRTKNYTREAKYIVQLANQYNADLIVTRPEYGGYRIIESGYWTPRFRKLLKK
jgi:hypothetical protein